MYGAPPCTFVGRQGHARYVAGEGTPQATKQQVPEWHWWRDPSWWRDTASKTVSTLISGLVVAVILKPSVRPWVLGLAIGGLVLLAGWMIARRVRRYRAALKAQGPPRHGMPTRRPARLAPGRPARDLRRRRPPLSSRRTAMLLAWALVGAVTAGVLVDAPPESGIDPSQDKPSISDTDEPR